MSSVHMTPPPISSQSIADLFCTIILLCRGRNTRGQPFWAYMCIKPSMADAFLQAQKSHSFHLEDFGTIIESGEGDEPPAEVKARMEREYAVKHNYEEMLLRAIEEIKRKKMDEGNG